MAIERSLAQLAKEWGVPFDALKTAKSMAGVYPCRRGNDGTDFYDRASVSVLHRLMVEKDAGPLFELERMHKARRRYLEMQLGRALTILEPLPIDELLEELLP
jgi:hypothetical protein